MQIIKRDAKKGGVLRLGTEVVSDDEGTVAALLGASPGASTAAPIMLQLMEKVFKEKINSAEWQAKLKAIIPSYGTRLDGNAAEIEKALAWTSEVLELRYEPLTEADNVPQATLKPLPEGNLSLTSRCKRFSGGAGRRIHSSGINAQRLRRWFRPLSRYDISRRYSPGYKPRWAAYCYSAACPHRPGQPSQTASLFTIRAGHHG